MLVTMLWHCTWERGREGAMALIPLSDGFQSLSLLPTIKLCPSGADSRVGGLVHSLGPCGSLQWTLLWGWEFLLLQPQPPQVFPIRGLRLYLPVLEPWVVQSALLPRLPPSLSMRECGSTGSASHPLAASPLCPAVHLCPSYQFGWMFLLYVLGCRTSIQFYFLSSGCFLFLNCCCPSFGCARRHSVSTYASILAGKSFF